MTFDEWFHKEYEPADLQIKQYAENKEGLHIPATVYLEDLKKAFEAGQEGKVVEHFEAYGQCRDSRRIAELERNVAYYAERAKHAELAGRDYVLKNKDLEEKLANADYQLEGRDLEIKELEVQIEKMKCCGNCAKRGHICVAEEMQGKLCGKNKDKWELRR